MHAFMSVSYTHLDVYKRQMQTCSRRLWSPYNYAIYARSAPRHNVYDYDYYYYYYYCLLTTNFNINIILIHLIFNSKEIEYYYMIYDKLWYKYNCLRQIVHSTQ